METLPVELGVKLEGPLRFFLSKHFYHSYLCCGEECEIFLLEHIDHSWIIVVASLGTFHGFLIKVLYVEAISRNTRDRITGSRVWKNHMQ